MYLSLYLSGELDMPLFVWIELSSIPALSLLKVGVALDMGMGYSVKVIVVRKVNVIFLIKKYNGVAEVSSIIGFKNKLITNLVKLRLGNL